MMRIIHVSESDLHGGASLSAYRIHRALVESGADSRFLVSWKLSDDPTVAEIFPRRGSTLRRRVLERLDQLPLWKYPRRSRALFSVNWAPNRAWRSIAAAQPSVVHLHWMNHGLLPVRDLARLGAPIVWNLWDQWAFTGGCHYSGDCNRYTRECGECPALASARARDLSTRVFARKRDAWSGLSFQLIAPSEWMAGKARASTLLGHHPCNVLAQPVDTRVFRPLPPDQARSLLGLDAGARIILVGASDLNEARKGFDLAEAAVRAANFDAQHNTLLCTFGDRPANAVDRLGGARVRHLGRLRDELTVALAFSAADVVLVPSREDAGPQITVEALACGTPVVGFPIGVTADLVQHQQNGYIARCFEPASLADGLHSVLARRGDPALRAAAREAALKHADVRGQVPSYLKLYADALAATSRSS